MLLRKRSSRIDHRRFSPSAGLTKQSLTFLPADAKLRPLRDILIVEPDEVCFSRILITPTDSRPLSGIVRAAGRGCWKLGYQDKHGNKIPGSDRKRRAKSYETGTWIPVTVRIGDHVELGGAEQGGYAFDTFWWGDKLMLLCREADVCGVRDPEPLAAGAVA